MNLLKRMKTHLWNKIKEWLPSLIILGLVYIYVVFTHGGGMAGGPNWKEMQLIRENFNISTTTLTQSLTEEQMRSLREIVWCMKMNPNLLNELADDFKIEQ